MTITLDLPPELALFVRTEVATGVAANEAELLTKAAEVYRSLRLKPDVPAKERLPDPPWLDECIPAPFDLPRAAATRVHPRPVAERLPEPFEFREAYS